jgi:hypothetical protein
MFNKIHKNPFRESRLCFGVQKVETASEKARAGVDNLENAVNGYLKNRGEARENLEIESSGDRLRLKATMALRRNMQRVHREMMKDRSGQSFVATDDHGKVRDFVKRLSAIYRNDPDKQRDLMYVDPVLDTEGGLEIKINLYPGGRSGGDTAAIPDVMFLRYTERNDIPGIEVLWSDNKVPSRYEDMRFLPIVDPADFREIRRTELANIPTAPLSIDIDLTDNNPYKDYLIEALQDRNLAEMNIRTVSRKDGILTINNNVKFEGMAYRGIFWEEILGKLNTKLAPHGISKLAILKGAKARNPKLETLIEKIVRGEEMKPALVKKVAEALSVYMSARERAEVKDESTSSRLEMRRQLPRPIPNATRIELKKLIGQEPLKVNDDLSKQLQTEGGIQGLMEEFRRTGDDADALIQRSEHGINADTWSISDREGLIRVFSDFKTLGIYQSNNFYNLTFRELSKASDPVFLAPFSPEKRNLYKNPLAEENFEKLDTLGDPSFVKAVTYFKVIRDQLVTMDKLELQARNRTQNVDEEPILETAGKALRDNWNTFTEAIENKDWTTAAVYAGGIFVLYRLLKSLPADSKAGWLNKDWIGKGLLWGGAGYAAYIFARNAGFDIGEELGLKPKDSEVAGTAFYSLKQIVPGVDVDGRILMDMGNVSMLSLRENYLKTNKSGIKWMNPAMFPNQFPRLAKMSPSQLEGNESLSSREKEYRRVGNQLYKIVKAFEQAYERTMGKNNEMTFDQYLKQEGRMIQTMNVMQFVILLKTYVPHEYSERRVFKAEGAEYKEMEQQLGEVFSKNEMPFAMEKVLGDQGGVLATVMGYPVVIRKNVVSGKYEIYNRNVYNDKGGLVTVSEAMVTMKVSGAGFRAEDLKKQIRAEMTKMAGVFGAGAETGTKVSPTPIYRDGHWYIKIEYAKGELLTNDVKQEFMVRPNARLSSLVILSGTDEAVNLEGVRGGYGELVIDECLKQGGDFEVLKYMRQVGKMSFIDTDLSDNKFKLQLGKSVAIVKFEGGKYTIENEADLLKDFNFRMELADAAIRDSRLLEGKLERFAKALGQAPEWWLGKFFGSLGRWATEATRASIFRGMLDAAQYSGSVRDNDALGIMNAQLEFFKAKFASAEVKNLENLPTAMNQTLKPSIKALDDFIVEFEAMVLEKNAEGHAFDSDEFNVEILNKLMSVGIESTDYKNWHRGFVNKIFERYAHNDLDERGAKNAAIIVSTFNHYTAAVDSTNIDGADLGNPHDPKTKAHDDAKEYVNYVYDRIDRKLNQLGHVNGITINGVGDFGRIKTFEEYQKAPERVTFTLINEEKPMVMRSTFTSITNANRVFMDPDALANRAFSSTLLPNLADNAVLKAWIDESEKRSPLELALQKEIMDLMEGTIKNYRNNPFAGIMNEAIFKRNIENYFLMPVNLYVTGYKSNRPIPLGVTPDIQAAYQEAIKDGDVPSQKRYEAIINNIEPEVQAAYNDAINSSKNVIIYNDFLKLSYSLEQELLGKGTLTKQMQEDLIKSYAHEFIQGTLINDRKDIFPDIPLATRIEALIKRNI